MAMNVGSGRSLSEPELMIEMNTTPLIDVMLVLLVMLIITIPIQLHSVNLNMPVKMPPPPPTELPEVVEIGIDNVGSILWNGERVEDIRKLDAKFSDAAHQSVPPELHVRPDKAAPYRAVTAVMASAQRNKATKIGIVGNEQYI
ncbi:MAG: biopolymer transporter ExbD [Methylophilaceae bacterium]|nr:biopolymer transporter ExbD [Methylophilaceae bacterium]